MTFEVLKLETFKLVRESQELNIKLISVTFEVSKLERSSEVKEEHFVLSKEKKKISCKNIRYIVVTLEVSITLEPKLMDVN